MVESVAVTVKKNMKKQASWLTHIIAGAVVIAALGFLVWKLADPKPCKNTDCPCDYCTCRPPCQCPDQYPVYP